MKNLIKVALSAMLLSTSVAFAADNVETLSNGVTVTHLSQGMGYKPSSANSKVTVTYIGTFNDGKVFDQSAQPITFPLNGVIPCWTTGLQTMKVGETAKLTCPSDTAYGSKGVASIPPNTPLNFEVKLLSVVN